MNFLQSCAYRNVIERLELLYFSLRFLNFLLVLIITQYFMQYALLERCLEAQIKLTILHILYEKCMKID